jgi:DNA-binding CsgD family transcriptional regulator/tetratricopeptide (TPR) repeat protein
MSAGFTSARFIGRERELVRIADALEAVADGRASTLLIAGSGGLGVGRLLDEAERRIRLLPEPIAVTRCRSRPGRSGDPFGTIVPSLERLVAGLTDPELARVAGTGAEELARLLPDLGQRIAGLGILPTRPTVTEPERRQTRVLESILGLLSRMAERTPMVLILEDLQWADAGTRALATFLARVSRPGRILVLATYQPDDLTRSHPLRTALAAMADGSQPPGTITLQPFDRDELAEFIEGIEGERPSASVLLLVAERSRGNALLAEELLAARRELAGASLTGSLDELVMARLSGRTPECRRILRLLAPAGEPLRVDELAAASAAFERTADRPAPRSSSAPRRGSGILDPDLAVGLVEAIEHGFVTVELPVTGRESAAHGSHSRGLTTAGGQRPDASPDAVGPERLFAPADAVALPADARLGFRHELIARAVEADLLPAQRRRHHSALAEGLASRPGSRARQHLAAHEPGPARVAAIEAAALAEAMASPGDALAHLELALELDDRTTPPGGPADPGGPVGLAARAAEAAFADGRPTRAAAFAESAIARLDERADRITLGLLHERLGRYRRAAGDQDGSIVAHRRAVELIPPEPTRERALVLASLAQVRMLEGMFSEAEALCREAIEAARAAGPVARGEEGHAICTLGISRAWGEDPEAGVALLREARSIAEELGRMDDLFRATANLTTALDLLGRRREAVDVAMTGIEAARSAGQEAIYGNFLRGNGADSLFLLGRWEESRRLGETALEWSPAGVNFVNAVSNLAIVEIESRADERAGRLLGRLLLELETVPDAQDSVPAYRAAAAFALWRGDLADAHRAAELGWVRVRETEDWVLVAKMAAMAVETDAAIVIDARDRRDLSALAAARERSGRVLAEAEDAVASAGVARTIGSRREADAHLATARAYRARLEGRDEAATWDALAQTWDSLGIPYEVARARWRQAEAALGAGDGRPGRAAARKPLLEGVRIARHLGARPLLRELEELAGRALIAIPAASVVHPAGSGEWSPESHRPASGERVSVAVGVGPLVGSDERGSGAARVAQQTAGTGRIAREFVGPARPRTEAFGLSPREKEVLLLLAEGRTNREIGERLFISQKTVGVHVGNILSKLGVSGRVEAAAVAIRLGLTDRR